MKKTITNLTICIIGSISIFSCSKGSKTDRSSNPISEANDSSASVPITPYINFAVIVDCKNKAGNDLYKNLDAVVTTFDYVDPDSKKIVRFPSEEIVMITSIFTPETDAAYASLIGRDYPLKCVNGNIGVGIFLVNSNGKANTLKPSATFEIDCASLLSRYSAKRIAGFSYLARLSCSNSSNDNLEIDAIEDSTVIDTSPIGPQPIPENG
ncbi:MAG: hypothetical protein EOP07_04630 [Proteobacteria bacterium]|nr:MAG: hypothetical protein EOP07_04630 [Pseudomonadota bacterium]